jgi:hypothetical protein
MLNFLKPSLLHLSRFYPNMLHLSDTHLSAPICTYRRLLSNQLSTIGLMKLEHLLWLWEMLSVHNILRNHSPLAD